MTCRTRNTQRVLIVGQHGCDLERLIQALDQDHALLVVGDGEGAVRLLAGEDCPDAVIAACDDPHLDVPDLLGVARDCVPLVPVIVTAQRGAREQAVQMLRLGACDLMERPFECADLLRWRLERALESRMLPAELLRRRGEVETLRRYKRVVSADLHRRLAQLLRRVVEVGEAHDLEGEGSTREAGALLADVQWMTTELDECAIWQRLEHHEVRLDVVRVGMETCLDAALRRLPRIVGERLERPFRLPEVYVDQERTVEILMCLLGALARQDPAGGLTLEAGLRGELVEIRLAPAPSGRGHALPETFPPQGRREEGAEDRVELARILVELQGGTLRAEALPGGMAAYRFTLLAARRPRWLPVARGPAPPIALALTAAPKPVIVRSRPRPQPSTHGGQRPPGPDGRQGRGTG